MQANARAVESPLVVLRDASIAESVLAAAVASRK